MSAQAAAAFAGPAIGALTSFFGARGQKRALERATQFQREALARNEQVAESLLGLQNRVAYEPIVRGERGRAMLDALFYGQGRYGPAAPDATSRAVAAFTNSRTGPPQATGPAAAFYGASPAPAPSGPRRIRLRPEAFR